MNPSQAMFMQHKETNEVSNFFIELFSSKNRARIFYVFAFIPLILMVLCQPRWPFVVISPVYGFILLTLKKEDIFSHNNADKVQKIIGIMVVLSSFFVYYPLVSLFPRASFYTVANYAIFIIGLFLLFFETPALKQALTPLLLVVADTANSVLFDGLEPLLSPYIGQFILLMSFLLKALGLNITAQYPNVITLQTTSGSIAALITWGCVAGSSIIFSIILVVFLLEEKAKPRTKLFWALTGILGTFVINVIRVTLIFVSWQLYGYEAGEKVHWVAGYALFITWLTLFLYTFTKRQTLFTQIKSIPHRLRNVP